MKVLIRPRLETAFTVWLDRADIPNQAGYRVLAKLANGLEVLTNVVRGPDGMHKLADVAIRDVSGWIPAPNPEPKAE